MLKRLLNKFRAFLGLYDPFATVKTAHGDSIELIYHEPDPVPERVCPWCYSNIYSDHAHDSRCPYCGGMLDLYSKIREELNA